MIYDQENLYFDAASAITSGSNVILNQGGGDAYDTLYLVAESDTKEPAALTFALQTSDAENFGSYKVLGTFTSEANAEGLLIAAKVPHGALKYSRLVGTGSPAGKITAGLVIDVPNWYK